MSELLKARGKKFSFTPRRIFNMLNSGRKKGKEKKGKKPESYRKWFIESSKITKKVTCFLVNSTLKFLCVDVS